MMEAATFEGIVEITVEIKENSDAIYLHQKNLSFTNISITQLQLAEAPEVAIPANPICGFISKNYSFISRFLYISNL